MERITKSEPHNIGLPPGSLMFFGTKKIDKARISVFDYDQDNFSERVDVSIDECFPFKAKPVITWMNIDGLHDTELIEKIGKQFEIHPLVLEDILHTEQRPKVEVFDDYIYCVIKMLDFDEHEFKIVSEQVSIILGKNFIISFQEQAGDVFDPIRERIRKAKGVIRKSDSDYLAYTLLDVVIDYYFNILEKVGDRIEKLEEDLMDQPQPATLNEIYCLKREVLLLRKSVWPLREIISALERSESVLIHKKSVPYFRDLYDHIIRVIDTVETSRDLISGMLDLYLSSVSNRMNEIMKVLTIISTIFIPITFIVGVYGTNFEYLPELKFHFGYFAMWIVMVIIAIVMLFYFRRKKWL